jgi:hypothetical protein
MALRPGNVGNDPHRPSERYFGPLCEGASLFAGQDDRYTELAVLLAVLAR